MLPFEFFPCQEKYDKLTNSYSVLFRSIACKNWEFLMAYLISRYGRLKKNIEIFHTSVGCFFFKWEIKCMY